MESFRLHREQWVPRSIEDVYAFFGYRARKVIEMQGAGVRP
jgi:hypothetical protein